MIRMVTKRRGNEGGPNHIISIHQAIKGPGLDEEPRGNTAAGSLYLKNGVGLFEYNHVYHPCHTCMKSRIPRVGKCVNCAKFKEQFIGDLQDGPRKPRVS